MHIGKFLAAIFQENNGPVKSKLALEKTDLVDHIFAGMLFAIGVLVLSGHN